MPQVTKSINGELCVNIAGVLLLAAHEPTPKGLLALQAFLRIAKKKGCPISTDVAETTLVSESAKGHLASPRARKLATKIAKFISASDVQEALRA